MGRPPSNGGPAFRFTTTEVEEMDTVLQEHHNQMPVREILVSLAEKFSESADRKGKIVVQFKQVWNWFQNRRYAIRAKSSKVPGKLNITSMPRDDSVPVRNVPQPVAAPMPPPMTAPISAAMPASTVPGAGRHMSESYMEFEAKSSRDGAWYDVATFLAHRYLEMGDPEVEVRFAGFGPEEDEWVNIRKHVRQRSLPCEASECVAVLPGDLILCFQVDIRKNCKSMITCKQSLRVYISLIKPFLRFNFLNALKIFRKVKIRLFTLMPMPLMRKGGGMMYEVVVVDFWCAMIMINPRKLYL
ncbi:protein SAWADEE HOMEODOMAIN HOMOLOG 2-like [Durio zibethinus]|uniref:Protein SAWADEE HOMEODOMAIN HOMOLOG 2-like n=1 Tax=Durio zibethinus TaxID=66656 RepID=A0A6P5Y225_DURZI|nr:protein SAWADEE HOMEODOMAIN HOMOLOG 2-like [Durio zibethinus]